MSTFIPKANRKDVYFIEIDKRFGRHNISDSLTEKRMAAAQSGKIFVLNIDITDKEKQIELALHLLYKYDIKYMNISFTWFKSYNGLITLLNSYRNLEYITIKVNLAYWRVSNNKINYELLYDALKSQADTQKICVKIGSVFPSKMMNELSKLGEKRLRRVKFTQPYWYKNEDAARINNEIVKYIKNCTITSLYINSNIFATSILRGLIKNTHIKFLHFNLSNTFNHHNTKAIKIYINVEYLTDKVIRNNKTLKWISFHSGHTDIYEKMFGNIYNNFKSNSGLKLYLYNRPIN